MRITCLECGMPRSYSVKRFPNRILQKRLVVDCNTVPPTKTLKMVTMGYVCSICTRKGRMKKYQGGLLEKVGKSLTAGKFGS